MEHIFTTYNAVILVGIVLLTQLVKGYVYPKWGKTGVQVLTFIISLIGVGIYQYAQYSEVFASAIKYALGFLTAAIALYEVILSKIGFNSAKEITK